jgi:hypothetical protein
MERCPSEHGQWRCVWELGHGGAHTAPQEGNRAVRWGMVGIGCCDPLCNRRPDHAGPHRDGHGLSWVPIDDVDYDEFLAWVRTRDREES